MDFDGGSIAACCPFRKGNNFGHNFSFDYHAKLSPYSGTRLRTTVVVADQGSLGDR